MSSRTFKEDKKTGFYFSDIVEEVRYGRVLSKEERKEKAKEDAKAKAIAYKELVKKELNAYYGLKDELDNLIQKAKANPKDESIKARILEKREEVEHFVHTHPAVKDHLDWQEEEKRKASLKRQAETIVNAKRNSEPLELLKKQQEEAKAKEKADRLQNALQRIEVAKAKAKEEAEAKAKAQAEAEAKAKAEAEAEKAKRLDDLVTKLNQTIGGYGY